jgi:hypothetical protein
MTNPKQIKQKNSSQLLATLSGLGGLLGKKVLVNVGENTTLGDGNVSQKLVQFLIVSDGKLEMTGNDTGLLVVASGVSSKLKDFGSEVLEDGGQVDGGTSTNALSIVALAQKTVNTTDGESQASLRRTRLRVLAAASLATRFASSHFVCWKRVRI